MKLYFPEEARLVVSEPISHLGRQFEAGDICTARAFQYILVGKINIKLGVVSGVYYGSSEANGDTCPDRTSVTGILKEWRRIYHDYAEKTEKDFWMSPYWAPVPPKK